MKRIWIVALATMIAGCSRDISPFSPTIKPDTPATRAPDPVVFDRTKFSILTGESLDLGTRAKNSSGVALTWASSNTSVATVENGVVTGKGFDTVTVSVTPSGGTPTEVKIWVGKPASSFTASTQGCPTDAEVRFVSSAIPFMNFDGDTTTTVCSGGPGTVAMTKVRAATYRGIANLASLRIDSIPWARDSRNLFEWFAFDSKLLGMHFVNGVKANGECCENLSGAWGVILVNADGIDKTYDARALAAYIAFLMHEARHIGFGAHLCLKNGLGQDNNLTEMGPHAINYLFTKWLSTTALLTPDEQAREAAYAETVRKSWFCSPPAPTP